MKSMAWLTVLGLTVAGAEATAQDNGRGGWEGRVFLDFNGGYQAASPDFAYIDTQDLFLEEAKAEASIKGSRTATFDVVGGFRVAGNFGIGAAISHFSSQGPASLTITIPHPLFFNQPAVDTINTTLERAETGIHLQAIYRIPLTRKLQVSVFGGPSHFNLSQDLLSDASGDLSLDADLAMEFDLTEVVKKPVEESVWGYNLGGDVTYLFSKHVGIGGGVRYSHASVQLENALKTTRTDSVEKTVQADLGGLEVTAGLRLRF